MFAHEIEHILTNLIGYFLSSDSKHKQFLHTISFIYFLVTCALTLFPVEFVYSHIFVLNLFAYILKKLNISGFLCSFFLHRFHFHGRLNDVKRIFLHRSLVWSKQYLLHMKHRPQTTMNRLETIRSRCDRFAIFLLNFNRLHWE